MIRFGIIKDMVNKTLCNIKDIGGSDIQDTMVNVKGIYTRPKNSEAIILPTMSGETQNILIPLQQPVDIAENDVIYTDDKSFIHLHYKDGEITIKTNKLTVDAPETVFTGNVTVDKDVTVTGNTTVGGNITGNGGSIKHNSTEIGEAHLHTANAEYADTKTVKDS